MDTENTNSTVSSDTSSDTRRATDTVAPTNSLEQLIQDVAARAEISESASEHVVDMVLTSVKRKLPDNMSSRLVAVMSGEDSFGSAGEPRNGDRANADRFTETIGDVGDNITRVGGQVLEDATRIGGRAFEEAGRVGSRVVDDASVAADKLSRWAKDVIDKQKDKN